MAKNEDKKTPQNISALLSEIGEKMVLFKLYQLTHENDDIEIFKNYSESGYDIGIRDSITGEKVKIEVKTRQRLITTSSENNKNNCQFTLTKNEKESADFLIGYWLDFNIFFIVPTSQLTSVKSNKKDIYKYVVNKYKNPKNIEQIYSKNSKDFYENWNSINELLNKKSRCLVLQRLIEKKLDLGEEEIARLKSWFTDIHLKFVYVEEYESLAQVKEILEKIKTQKLEDHKLKKYENVAQLRDLELKFEDKVLSIEDMIKRNKETQACYSSIGFSLISLKKINQETLTRFENLGLEIKYYNTVLKQLKLI